MTLGNLFAALPATPEHEAFETLLEHRGVKIERIVSSGQASAPGFWYDEPRVEWVAVLAGRARRRHHALEMADIVAKRLTEATAFNKIALHVDHDQRGARRFKNIIEGLCPDGDGMPICRLRKTNFLVHARLPWETCAEA